MANGHKKWTLAGIWSVFLKELIQLKRDPYLVAFIIILPLAQLLITGLAVERDMKHIPTIVCNYDNHNASVELLKAYENSQLFHLNQYVSSETAITKSLRTGKYRIGIIIPPEYSAQLLKGETPTIKIMVDGTHGNIAKSIVNGATMVANKHLSQLKNNQVLSSGIPEVQSAVEAKVLYNPEMKSSYFLVPAILAIIMHMMTILFTSFAIVRERENGTLEQLMVTPVLKTDLMMGKVLPYALIGLFDMILTLVVMIWFFDIAITGSFWFLCLASMIFILASLGMGLIISTTCHTQVQAIQLTVAIFLPSLLLSGFVFPLEPMPWVIKIISYTLPLTYYLDIIRGIVIKGIGFQELWTQTFVLLIMASAMVFASIAGFKKQVA